MARLKVEPKGEKMKVLEYQKKNKAFQHLIQNLGHMLKEQKKYVTMLRREYN